ncbi:hypothetical protein K431DRAFT_225673 [Polychaeton citri CBS 116435]|uniref:Major facilitator superfamily (MFS) profile domain-containing protein n=1 Tax=Polychaeton citri CBS 116435 TaxID=1314669 RepID=A0A9P4UM31_9PEZI|nr:hypothetical protein K431DRAFT_225673 [Polychaeton citri CBS 116435]
MAILSRFKKQADQSGSEEATPRHSGGPLPTGEAEKQDVDNSRVRMLHPRVFAIVLIVSLGGLIFGYDTGQISGFLEMPDFLRRFHNTTNEDGSPAFTPARSGTIVGLLSIGTLIGAIIAGPIADFLGRRISIVIWDTVFCIGVIVQITTVDKWYQIAIGRWVAGLGVGGLSCLTPLYMSETAPRTIRGSMVGCYQLFITLGIFIAYCINYGTEKNNNASAWRIPMGVGFIFPVIMAVGIMFLRESPRWDYRKGNVAAARTTIAKSYHVPENHWEVNREMTEIQVKFDAENAGGGKHPWYEVFTGPRMAYRTTLGIVIQALQQLTGANFFFYYGTTIFAATGISNSYVTSMILGGINFGCTFVGIAVVQKVGRRKALMCGAAWMFMCFMVFSFVGHFSLDKQNPMNSPGAGTVMIVFAALFIAAYAVTWGPIAWAVTSEIFPTRYRAKAVGLSTASNWIWNFLISFFTPYITNDIDYLYGLVFAGCSFAAIFFVYFFLCESKGRSLEEIDTMYLMHVKPWQSSKWVPPPPDQLITADSLFLKPGARGIQKADAAGMESTQRNESIPAPTENHGVHDISGTQFVPEAAGVRGNSIYR